MQWLRDNLGIIKDAAEIEEFAASVDDNGGVYFVPAFSGLFAPRLRPDARGVRSGSRRRLLVREDDIRANCAADKTWEPDLDSEAREAMYRKRNRAVERTYDSA